jgi:hypothetical protein
MVAGDGELVGEEAATEEVIMTEVIAVGSGLKLVLDKGWVTAKLIPGSGGDGGGRCWPAAVSRGRQPRAEHSGAKVSTRQQNRRGALPLGVGAGIRPHPRGSTATVRRWPCRRERSPP